MNAARSASLISLNRTFGLRTGPSLLRCSVVHIFWGSRFRCGCAVIVFPSSRT